MAHPDKGFASVAETALSRFAFWRSGSLVLS
jgi:hypothetical protein